MKTIGLIGGMSWESTATYYKLINEGVKAKLGGHHSAKLILYSVDFAGIEHLQRTNQWAEAGQLLANAARLLEKAGAEFIVLCTNTMHKVAPAIESAISIPLLHIADPTAAAIKAAGIKTVGLLGTKITMEQEFYIERLRSHHQLNVVVPCEGDRHAVHRVIYEELVHGKVVDASRQQYVAVVNRLKDQGMQALILGCTEIGMLVESGSLDIPCFDPTELHAEGAIDYCLSVARGD
jgi:aspartate racemase